MVCALVPDQTVRVQVLAKDIVLCCWATHFTPAVPLPAQVYKSHTRLRLNSSAGKRLFQKSCCLLHAFPPCDAPVEDPKHYNLHCPSFAALRENLFASVAQLLGNR